MRIVVDIALALVGAVLFPSLICDETAGFSGGIFSALLFGALLVLFRRSHWKKSGWRLILFSHLAGFLFSLMTAFGFYLENLGGVDYGSGKLWLTIAFYTHVYGQLLSLLWAFLEGLEPKLEKPNYGRKLAAVERGLDWFLRKPWLVMPVILLLWLPCYLGTYPGNFVYDATKEFSQLETGYLGDFPMLHSVLITKLLSWSAAKTGGYELGIAVFTVAQMLLLSAMFTHMLCKFRSLGGNRFVLAVLLLYCGAFPAIHLLVTSTVRDVLFSGLLTYSVFLLWLMCRDVKGFLGSWWKPIGPAAVLVLTVFSRNNNAGLVMPVALALISLVLFLVGGKRGWKGAVVFAVTALGSFVLTNSVLTNICQPVTEPTANASMAMYTQSLARAYTLEGEEWSAGEKLTMVRFFRTADLRYVPENGDPTKGKLRLETEEDREEFLEFWGTMGKRYPGHYADAILANTRPMWFPGVVIDGYQEAGVGLYKPYEKCYFYYADELEAPGELDSKWPEAHEWYQELALQISFEKVPVLSLLFSIGFHFWLLLGCCFYAMYRKARQLYLPLAILLAYAFISAFVPLILLRYFAALFFAFPIVIMFLLHPHLGNTADGRGTAE